jgi:hypothetical protein
MQEHFDELHASGEEVPPLRDLRAPSFGKSEGRHFLASKKGSYRIFERRTKL